MSDDYYSLLELTSGASADEIRTAIREQRRVWVRRQSSPDPDRRTLAEQRVRDLDAAEKVLLDVAARADYDRQLGRGGASRSGAGRGGASRGGASRTGTAGSTGSDTSRPPEPTSRRRKPTPSGSPSSSGTPTPDGPEGHRRLAQNHLAAGQYRQAVTEFEAVLAADPSDSGARAGLAECYLHTERVEDGLATLKELVAAEPENQEFRLTYAYALYQQAWDGLAEVSDGRLAMSRRQVSLLRRNERRIRALGIDDPQVEGWRGQLESLLQDATRRRKVPSDRKRYYAGGVLVALVLALLGPTSLYQVVGALFLVFVVWTYVQRHRPAMWQVRRKQLRRQTLQRGI